MAYDPATLQLAITVILGIYDRAAAFLKSGIVSREQEFKEIAEPLYRELQPIAADLFEQFVKAQQEIEQCGDANFDKPLEGLRKRREILRSARVELSSRAASLREISKDEALSAFLNSIVSFIESPALINASEPQSPTIPKRSRAVTMIDGMQLLVTKKATKADLLSYIGIAIEQMEKSWADVAARYARVQARYLRTGSSH